MKTYKITVGGKTYEVGVEEIGGAPEVRAVLQTASAPKPAPKPAPAPKAAAPAAAPKAAPAAPAPAPAPKPVDAPVQASGGGSDVSAPMSGKVLSINVSVGDQVKTGQLLLVFEAMKMENELFAPSDGTISKIHVEKGATLEAGAPVITIS